VAKLRVCALAVLMAAGCGNGDADGGERPPAVDRSQPASSEVAQTYAPALNVDLARMTRSENGLYVEDLRAGEGPVAEAGQVVVVHYTGWLTDGTRFDSSRDGDNPFPVRIGTGEVIDGWDLGIPGMRVGGERRLVIPPSLGYGNAGAGGVIPPGATLIFDVELLEIR
jgi:FKBP-type peptidyl-prolyl cis-trans isomerase